MAIKNRRKRYIVLELVLEITKNMKICLKDRDVIEIENLNYIIKNNKYNTCLCVECKTQEELNELLKQLNLDVKINFTKPLHLKIILKGDGTVDVTI